MQYIRIFVYNLFIGGGMLKIVTVELKKNILGVLFYSFQHLPHYLV